MAHPYQCILSYNDCSSQDSKWILFGASGPKLVVQSSSGVTSVWSPEKGETDDNHKDEPAEPPGKKIKLSPPVEKAYNFTTMVISNDCKYLVAITGEDKCIHVFQVGTDGQLQRLSQRCMPRRPSAIALTPDGSTILCADKFGDVYGLPLLWSPADEPVETPATESDEAASQKQYTPAASVLTVHSGRNRKVLEEQMKQAAKQKQPKAKQEFKFKHDLLLGHVSMLTDILFTSVESPTESGKPRGYVLTADRDEHIRISRAPPQAHVIEGFCQGHEEFVSRLCLTKSGLLVSGGGDPELYVWDWLNYRLLETLSIAAPVWDLFKSNQFGNSLPEDKDQFNVAVCGIWSVPGLESQGDEMLVACEGVPALFHFTIRGQGASSALSNVIQLNGNALGVAFVSVSTTAATVVVSVDNVHKPGSVTEVRETEEACRLQYFTFTPDRAWKSEVGLESRLEWLSREAGTQLDEMGNHQGDSDKQGMEAARKTAAEKAVRESLYGMEKLRKRPGAED